MTDVQPYDVLGSTWRWGTTEDGTPFAVAADIARSFGHRDAHNALRIVAEDEKGTRLVSTPGGPQQMWVIYEDGIWELVFRSSKEEALRLKKRVKEILRALRTGDAQLVSRQLSRKELARFWYEAEERAELAEARAAELAPSAEAWDVLASADGDYAVADAAKILARDGIKTGERRLFEQMGQFGWTYRHRLDGRWRAYQTHVDRGLLAERAGSHVHPLTGERVASVPQIRVTAEGLAALRRALSAGTDLGEAA